MRSWYVKGVKNFHSWLNNLLPRNKEIMNHTDVNTLKQLLSPYILFPFERMFSSIGVCLQSDSQYDEMNPQCLTTDQ